MRRSAGRHHPPVVAAVTWLVLQVTVVAATPPSSPCGRAPLASAGPGDPPPGAVVLFDGVATDGLIMRRDGGPVSWPIRDGTLVVRRDAGDLLSREAFGDCLVHVEWLSPSGGDAADRNGGNSGVKLQTRYEIQILNNPGPPHGPHPTEAGSIYGIKAADRNASTGPDTWQTYDIWFTAPRWTDGRKVAPARITLVWNGQLVHHDVEVPKQTGVSMTEAPGDHPLLLQAHSSTAPRDVRFRNVWVLPNPVEAGLPPPGNIGH